MVASMPTPCHWLLNTCCITRMLTTFSSLLRNAHFAQRTGIKYTQHRIPMHIHHKSPLARLSCRAELCEQIPPGTYPAIQTRQPRDGERRACTAPTLNHQPRRTAWKDLHGTDHRLSTPTSSGGDGGRWRVHGIHHHTINPPGFLLGCKPSSCHETWRSASPSLTGH